MPKYIDLYQHLYEQSLTPLELDILKPDAEAADVAMYQCYGHIQASDHGVSAAKDETFLSKTEAFFEFVIQEQPALVLTPEYSTPLHLIDQLLFQGNAPRTGAIWILGCESCTRDELRLTIAKYPSVIWVTQLDELIDAPGQFLDPVLIVFKVTDEGTEKTCICIQFKTTQMGGDQVHQIEGNHLVKGTARYIIRGSPDSICLLTLVCSDAFDFSIEHLAGYRHSSFLICHIQMTKDPFHDRFSKYRYEILEGTTGWNHEFITLNWASNYTINNAVQSLDCGGSAYYMKPSKPDREPNLLDATIHKNHSAGIYLKFCKDRRDAAFYFHGTESIFHFSVRKVSQIFAADITQVIRYGARTLSTLVWDEVINSWSVHEDLPDGIEPIAKSIYAPLSGILNITPLDRERLITISLGKAGLEEGRLWYAPDQLIGLKVSKNEYPFGSMVKLRESQTSDLENQFLLLKYLVETVLPDLSSLTTVHDGFSLPGLKLGFSDKEFRSNIRRNGQNANALISYVGEIPEHRAQDILDRLLAFSGQKRIVLFYRLGDMILPLESETPKIDEIANPPAYIADL